MLGEKASARIQVMSTSVIIYKSSYIFGHNTKELLMHSSTIKIILIVYTWPSPYRIHKNQFDYILVKRIGELNYNNEKLIVEFTAHEKFPSKLW